MAAEHKDNGNTVVQALIDALGAAHVTVDPAQQARYLSDWTGRFHGKCLALVRPGSTEQVAAVMRIASAHAVPVVVQSGNTSLVGGSTPAPSGCELLVSLERMNRIEAIDSINDTMTVQAGVILEQAQGAARQADRLFPLSFAAQGSACLGGCIATNAGGTAVLHYGNTRELVLGLEVVLPDGRILNMLRGLRKDNTGYDLKQLFIASEGTLGIITRAVVKLFALPRATFTALVGVETIGAACRLLQQVRQAEAAALTGFELMQSKCLLRVGQRMPSLSIPAGTAAAPWWCLIELSYMHEQQCNPLEAILEEAFEHSGIVDAVLASSLKDSQQLWAIRESIPSADAHVGGNLHNDVSLEISEIADFVDQTLQALQARFDWLDPSVFGHLGDGNLHFNVGSVPSRLAFENEQAIRDIVYERVVAHRGSISAEHGIGQLKREHFAALKNPLELELMGAIKRAIDPQNLLNQGKLLPSCAAEKPLV